MHIPVYEQFVFLGNHRHLIHDKTGRGNFTLEKMTRLLRDYRAGRIKCVGVVRFLIQNFISAPKARAKIDILIRVLFFRT